MRVLVFSLDRVVDLIATTVEYYGDTWERAWTEHITNWQPLGELYM